LMKRRINPMRSSISAAGLDQFSDEKL
jgi:hypothetical protein